MLTVGRAVLAGSLLTAAVQLVFPLRKFRFPAAGTRRCSGSCGCPSRLSAEQPLSGWTRWSTGISVRRCLRGTSTSSRVRGGLVTALLLVSSSGLSVVAFPDFALRHAAGRLDELAAEVAYALRGLSVLVVPIVVGLFSYSPLVVSQLV